jgi:hypothetical protein
MLDAGPLSLSVPFGADQTLFVVVDRIGGNKEARIERTDLDHTIGEFFAGCFSDPVRVLSFNTLEHWIRDVSAEVAAEIQSRCDIDGTDLPDHLRDFVETHICACGSSDAEVSFHSRVAAR